MPTPPKPNAVVWLITSDDYLPGVLTSLNSLLDVDPNRDWATVCLVIPATVGHRTRQALERAQFDQVVGVEPIATESLDELNLLGRRDLALALTKLHLFRLTQYDKILFLDADTLVLQPLSHLFDLDVPFAAAPDQGWPDAFNSGVFLARPSNETFEKLRGMMRERGTWDGADQGLLNDFFPNWHRLSFTYNVTPSAYYTYAPAYKRHGQDAYVLHFIGADKPWKRGSRSVYNPDAASKDYYGLVQQWFDVFERHFGSVSTWDVASRVRPAPDFTRSTFSSLPALSSSGQPSFQTPPPQSPIPTISVAPPGSDLPHAIPIVAQRAPSPPQLTWDPASSSPPRNGPLQMRDALPIAQYTNAWDDPSRARSKRFEPPARYPSPPRETHDWYKAVMQQKPDPSAVKPVFPWEQPASVPPTPSGRTPARPAGPPPPTRTFSDDFSRGGTPPANFASAATFTNAWDSVPGIKRYVDQLSKRTTGGSSRKSSVSAGGTVEKGGSASRPGSHGRRRSGSGASAKSVRRTSGEDVVAEGTGLGLRGENGSETTLSGLVGGAGKGGGSSDAGHLSDRDADDEDDEDADISTSASVTDEAASGAEEGSAAGGDDDEDSERDRIAIKFRQRPAAEGGFGAVSQRRSSSTSSSSPPLGESPSTKPRKDSRYVPTSPRQTRPSSSHNSPPSAQSSPHTSSLAGSSPYLSVPTPSLRLAIPGGSPSAARGPTSPGSGALSPRAQAVRNAAHARLVASGAGHGDNAPPVVRATRVFSPETDTSTVKQQGLAALQRFVESMEMAQTPEAPTGGAGNGGASYF
ncbi:hypothetical protein JCM10213_007207 [Rhodosporidiobolus nylandii]